MKKLIVFLALGLSTISLNAQFIDNDITASYGVVTTDQIVDIFKDILTTVFTFGTYEKDNYDYSGALFLTYKKALSYRVQFGGTIGTDRVSGDLLQDGIKYGDFNTKHTTLAPEIDLRWVKRNFFQMYSGIGMGYTFTSEKGKNYANTETDVNRSGHFAFQITALGMRFGRSFGGFIETGFGYKGIMNFGLSYQFE